MRERVVLVTTGAKSPEEQANTPTPGRGEKGNGGEAPAPVNEKAGATPAGGAAAETAAGNGYGRREQSNSSQKLLTPARHKRRPRGHRGWRRGPRRAPGARRRPHARPRARRGRRPTRQREEGGGDLGEQAGGDPLRREVASAEPEPASATSGSEPALGGGAGATYDTARAAPGRPCEEREHRHPSPAGWSAPTPRARELVGVLLEGLGREGPDPLGSPANRRPLGAVPQRAAAHIVKAARGQRAVARIGGLRLRA